VVGGLAAGLLLGRLLFARLEQEVTGAAFDAVLFVAGISIAAVWWLRRRRVKSEWLPPECMAPVAEPPPVHNADLDRGVRDIRRTDPGFDAARFAGYAAMMFRDVQDAGTARDARALRDRVTPAMYADLMAHCQWLVASGRSVCIAEVEVTSEVTEAWQDDDRDYVTAFIAGSMRSRQTDSATEAVVDGSPTVSEPVEAFLTFTRPPGLNFWMLSLIQATGVPGRA
jgi:predicted lipid-binding transport protein (Tim44 family)